MPDENPTSDVVISDVVAELDGIEREVIYLLTGDDLPVWAVEDLGRVLEQGRRIKDSVRSLRANGLVHQTADGHVFATRAAWRLVQLVGQVI
jgi:hypothetical protein